MTKIVTDAELHAEQLRSLSRVFEKADRILTGEEIECRVAEVQHIQAPAFSDGASITFNLPYIGSVVSTDHIIKVTGLNFHELAHTMFTPRKGEQITETVLRRGQFRTFNLLEDQRIETLLTSMYPSTEPYFVMAIMSYCLERPSQWKTAYPLVYGRRYLPKSIRAKLRDKFDQQQVLPEVESIIDEYRTLAFPADTDKGIALVDRMHKLLSGLGQDHANQEDPFGHGSGTRPEITEGSPLGDDDQEAAGEWVDYRDEEREEEGEDEKYDGDGKGDGEESDEEADGKGQGKGDGQDSSDGEGQGGEGDSNDPTNSDSDQAGKGAGLGSGGKAPSDGELRDLMKKIAENAKSLPEVQSDAKGKKDAMHKGMGTEPAVDQANFQEKPVDSTLIGMAKKFGQELRKIEVDADPGWHTHKSSGRVNLGRAMRGEELDTVFDVWDEGKLDATSIEMVLLVDTSGSMRYGAIEKASEAVWTIKRAVETIGGEVTVVGFDSTSNTLYKRQDKVGIKSLRSFYAGGGTNPTDAIASAAMIFDRSEKVHKIALFVTDGAWNGNIADACERRIREWNKAGITTALAYINDAVDEGSVPPIQHRHGTQVNRTVNSATALVPLARSIVKQAMTG